jgi:uncharacterized protein (TIGR02452 family)
MNRTPREVRADMARETLAIVEAGHYADATGRRVGIADAVAACVRATRLFMPDDVIEPPSEPGRLSTTFGVRNESTLTALARLGRDGCRRVGVLNFASAKHPGGGFQRGDPPQEEALARSSALYESLVSGPARAFYVRTGQDETSLYTDRVILSPDCPVFRDADGRLLPQLLPATFLTCAAPKTVDMRSNEPDLLPQLADTFVRRTARVLEVAAHAGCDALVLGAWGCGVFGNDPDLVAGVFARHLRAGGDFESRFACVDFAVLDSSEDQACLRAFERAFGHQP